jgi:hypothetical protein
VKGLLIPAVIIMIIAPLSIIIIIQAITSFVFGEAEEHHHSILVQGK